MPPTRDTSSARELVLERIPEHDRRAWYDRGWWSTATLADVVAGHAETLAEGAAFIADDERLSWGEYDRRSGCLAATLAACGLDRGERVAVMLPDGALVHTVFLAAEKAGLVVVGVGTKAGDRELAHLLTVTGASVLITPPQLRDRSGDELAAAIRSECPTLVRHVTVEDVSTGSIRVDGDLVEAPATDVRGRLLANRRLGPDELFLINSTSGTTGLPKCVMQHQNRWRYFHQLAVDAAALDANDVFLSAIPAPFGFGLWTAHFTPAYLGAPTVLMERFSASTMLDAIERQGVSVLCCVSTQFIMLLNELAKQPRELPSLRAMFTGGEAVPEQRAAEFERRTGASVLQFYGSNETGALSYTTHRDSRERRLTTAGRIIPEMQVRLFTESGHEITEPNTPGRPACKGPAMCGGYYRDVEANEQLFTPDGWMRIGDVAVIDDEGYLSVVGRTSDLIIRGGKNISAVQVEGEIASHPDVAMVAVVAMPDDVFGERVCAYVVPADDDAHLTLDALCAHLAGRGVGKELFPERLEVVDGFPMASGGKVAKGALRSDIAAKIACDRRADVSSAPAIVADDQSMRPKI